MCTEYIHIDGTIMDHLDWIMQSSKDQYEYQIWHRTWTCRARKSFQVQPILLAQAPRAHCSSLVSLDSPNLPGTEPKHA
jgi:hypothetical protein